MSAKKEAEPVIRVEVYMDNDDAEFGPIMHDVECATVADGWAKFSALFQAMNILYVEGVINNMSLTFVRCDKDEEGEE